MRHFLTILLLAGIAWLGWRFHGYAKRTMEKSQIQKVEDGAQPAPGKLPGMAASLEPSLEAARKQGPDGLRHWLRLHRHEVQDPRLTEIELDYVVLIGLSDADEARRVLAAIRPRMKPESPNYKRFTQLDKAF